MSGEQQVNPVESPEDDVLLRRYVTVAAICAASAIACAMVIRLTVRDAFVPASTIHYAFPIGVILAGSIFCFFCTLLIARRRIAICWAGWSVIVLIWWFHADWKTGTVPLVSVDAAEDSLTVMFWNVQRGRNLPGIAEFIRGVQPDVVGMVEVVGSPVDLRKFWNEELPEYDVSILGGGMELLVKNGTSGEAVPEIIGEGGSACRQITARVGGREIAFFVVDMDANPFRSREPALRRLTELTHEQTGTPVMILGDFNTPSDSIHFAPLREQHRLMFEEVGRGYRPTWPFPAPVLKLDHIWINRLLEPIDCRHGTSWASDHRPVIAWVRVASAVHPAASGPLSGGGNAPRGEGL